MNPLAWVVLLIIMYRTRKETGRKTIILTITLICICGGWAVLWHGKGEFPESTAILRDVFLRLLVANPSECRELIGTGVIEATYFDEEE